jgi:hypothetical protein
MVSVYFWKVMNMLYLSSSIGLMMARTRNGITPNSGGNFSDVTVWRVSVSGCRRYEHNNLLCVSECSTAVQFIGT